VTLLYAPLLLAGSGFALIFVWSAATHQDHGGSNLWSALVFAAAALAGGSGLVHAMRAQ
jgi:hypothetical protein